MQQGLLSTQISDAGPGIAVYNHNLKAPIDSSRVCLEALAQFRGRLRFISVDGRKYEPHVVRCEPGDRFIPRPIVLDANYFLGSGCPEQRRESRAILKDSFVG